MNTINPSHPAAKWPALHTTQSLRKLYILRTAFSIVWATGVFLNAKSQTHLAAILMIIYPLWDVLATWLDIRASSAQASKTPQYVNIGIGVITTTGVALALQSGVPAALRVFGVWAIVTGAIQLMLGLQRRKALGGQWPMIISGGQSVLAGVSFIAFAAKPGMGIGNLAGYALFGAFYFLLAAIRLWGKQKTGSV